MRCLFLIFVATLGRSHDEVPVVSGHLNFDRTTPSKFSEKEEIATCGALTVVGSRFHSCQSTCDIVGPVDLVARDDMSDQDREIVVVFNMSWPYTSCNTRKGDAKTIAEKIADGMKSAADNGQLQQLYEDAMKHWTPGCEATTISPNSIPPSTDDPQTPPSTDDPQTGPSTDDPQTGPSTDDPQAPPSTDDPQTGPSTRRLECNTWARMLPGISVDAKVEGTPASDKNTEDGPKTSAGAIAAIVIVSIVLLAVIVGFIMWKPGKEEANQGEEGDTANLLTPSS